MNALIHQPTRAAFSLPQESVLYMILSIAKSIQVTSSERCVYICSPPLVRRAYVEFWIIGLTDSFRFNFGTNIGTAWKCNVELYLIGLEQL